MIIRPFAQADPDLANDCNQIDTRPSSPEHTERMQKNGLFEVLVCHDGCNRDRGWDPRTIDSTRSNNCLG